MLLIDTVAFGSTVVISLPYDLLSAPEPIGSWEAYLAVLYGTGVVSIGSMAVGMQLALRLPFTDRLLGGLDRSYWAHK